MAASELSTNQRKKLSSPSFFPHTHQTTTTMTTFPRPPLMYPTRSWSNMMFRVTEKQWEDEDDETTRRQASNRLDLCLEGSVTSEKKDPNPHRAFARKEYKHDDILFHSVIYVGRREGQRGWTDSMAEKMLTRSTWVTLMSIVFFCSSTTHWPIFLTIWRANKFVGRQCTI